MNMLSPPFLDRLSVLGDETRTRILALLERSELTVGELCRVLQIPQPTVSRHLKTLAAEGWVEARADGRNRHYRVATDLGESSRALWNIVRGEIGESAPYATDTERVRSVLDERRLRSSAFFAASAGRWDAVRAELFGSATGLAPLLGLVDSAWVVGDLGVGTGALTASLAPFARRVIGVDRSSEMLDAAEARLAEADNVDLRIGELEALPIADAALDLAILALVLHYVVEPLAALTEARRVLGNGGRLVLLDMRPHGRGTEYAEQMGHVWAGFSAEQVSAWLTEAGFASTRVAPLPPDPDARGPLLFLASARA